MLFQQSLYKLTKTEDPKNLREFGNYVTEEHFLGSCGLTSETHCGNLICQT